MAVGEYFKIALIANHLVGGKTMVNNLYFKQIDPLILDTPEEDLYQAFQIEAQSLYLDGFTNFLTVITITIGKGPDFLTSFSQTVNLDGTASGDPMPPNIGGLLRYRSTDLTRRGRGRIFLFPANESVNSSGAPTSGYRDYIVSLGQAFKDDMSASTIDHAGWQWGMWSPSDQAFKPITTWGSAPFWGSQRDRRGVY